MCAPPSAGKNNSRTGAAKRSWRLSVPSIPHFVISARISLAPPTASALPRNRLARTSRPASIPRLRPGKNRRSSARDDTPGAHFSYKRPAGYLPSPPHQTQPVIPTGANRSLLACGFCMPVRAVEGSRHHGRLDSRLDFRKHSVRSSVPQPPPRLRTDSWHSPHHPTAYPFFLFCSSSHVFSGAK